MYRGYVLGLMCRQMGISLHEPLYAGMAWPTRWNVTISKHSSVCITQPMVKRIGSSWEALYRQAGRNATHEFGSKSNGKPSGNYQRMGLGADRIKVSHAREGQFVRRVLGAGEEGSVTNGPNMGIVACQCGQGQDQVPAAAATSQGVNVSTQ